MIHADLHSHNIMVADGELVVIDFDDAGFGWHQYDLAVALYDYRERDDFESLKNTMIEAYREQRNISDDDLSLLPLFMLIRALALIGWASARPELHAGRLPQGLIKTACQLATANVGLTHG